MLTAGQGKSLIIFFQYANRSICRLKRRTWQLQQVCIPVVVENGHCWTFLWTKRHISLCRPKGAQTTRAFGGLLCEFFWCYWHCHVRVLQVASYLKSFWRNLQLRVTVKRSILVRLPVLAFHSGIVRATTFTFTSMFVRCRFVSAQNVVLQMLCACVSVPYVLFSIDCDLCPIATTTTGFFCIVYRIYSKTTTPARFHQFFIWIFRFRVLESQHTMNVRCESKTRGSESRLHMRQAANACQVNAWMARAICNKPLELLWL